MSASILSYKIDIPQGSRRHTYSVFYLAAARIMSSMLNSNNFEAASEVGLLKSLRDYEKHVSLEPMPWVLPLFRDAMGLSPQELAEWDRDTPAVGQTAVLRAIAHAIFWRDL